MARSVVTQAKDESAIVSLVRHAAVAGIAGVISGVIVGGLGGRVVMRLSAIAGPDRLTGIPTSNGNRIGDITVGGTLELVILVGIFSGAFGAIAYLITEPWLEWAGRWHGLVFGVALLLMASTVVIEPENTDFAILSNQELNIGLFSALFIGFGLLMGWLHGALDARLPQVGQGKALPLYGILVTLGALFLIVFVAQFFDEGETNESDLTPVIGGFVVAMGMATLALWLLPIADRLNLRWMPLLRLTGYTMLGGMAITGAFRLINDVREIVWRRRIIGPDLEPVATLLIDAARRLSGHKTRSHQAAFRS